MAFTDIPVHQIGRTRVLRSARLGRPAPSTPAHVDAFRAISLVGEVKEAFQRERATIPFFDLFAEAFEARKTPDYPTP
jgi:hypothetical protein